MGLFDKKTPQAKVNGLPGVAPAEERMPPEVTLAMLNGNLTGIGEKDIAKATEILQKYKQGKSNLEKRIVENEQWYKLQHWDVLRREHNNTEGIVPMPEPSSGWLFNSLNNKHADAMDNFPEPMVLPREPSDEESAKLLSQILPVVLEYNEFERTYDRAWWGKLKNGAAVYGVFWNNELYNGLGDVEVREIDLLKIFWEPGITDIQDSANLFIVDLVDEEILDQQYPQFAGKMKGGVIDLNQYVYDDAVDVSHKSLVVDWYYKRTLPGGRKTVHYVKYVGNQVLYASENDPEFSNGWYADGKYPVVMDTLFPEAGTPVGFGYLDLCKDPQMYIDKLWGNILKHSDMATRLKFFSNVNNDIDEKELMDPNKMLVHCSGDVSEERLKQILTKPLDSIYANIIQMKVDEMKDTSSNRDVNSGSTGSGVTAAAAIAALQEAGNKSSRDMIKGSYRAHAGISQMCVERMRQFYTEERTFRITNGSGYGFVAFSGVSIQEQPMPPAYAGQETEPGYEPSFRVPVFDIKIHAQRKNPFSRMEQNERAKELYAAGFFAPENAQPALIALEMMDFEGREKIIEKVQQGQTLMNIVQQLAAQMDQMALIIQNLSGQKLGAGPENDAGDARKSGGSSVSNDEIRGEDALASGVMESQQAQTPYMQAMVKRSTPKME